MPVALPLLGLLAAGALALSGNAIASVPSLHHAELHELDRPARAAAAS